jgi:RNA recognition motif-containing protein
METIMKKIFVGNLSWKASEETLRPLFEAYGAVISIKIVTDQYTGKSKGFAFVEMESAEAAKAAIDGLNEKPVLDRNIRVSLAQERTERREFTPRNSSGPRNGGGGFRSGR